MPKSTSQTVILWRDVVEVLDKICSTHNLSYGQILPCVSKRYKDFGEAAACDRCSNSDQINEANCKEKIIKIRIHMANRPKRPLKSSTIFHTLAHETAHLRHWVHGKDHRKFTHEIIDFIQELGYDCSRNR